MTTAEGSRDLANRCAQVVDDLADFSTQLLHEGTTYMQHIEHAGRAEQFAQYLRGALTLAATPMYAQSLALLRTGMERWAIDSIILLGDRYVQLYAATSDEIHAAAVQRWKTGELPAVLEEPTLVGRNNATMRIVHRGLSAEANSDQVIHPLYFDIDNYDPFFGAPDEQPLLAGGGIYVDIRGVAEEYRRRYNAALRWRAILESLELNTLISPGHVLHLKVHYRFLSAFVHGHHAAFRSLEENRLRSPYSAEHIAEEIVLLYTAQLGARYLLNLLRMSERVPKVAIADRDRLALLASDLLSRSAHLWFLTDEPSAFDRGQEILDRAMETKSWTTRLDPMSLPVQSIRYYRHPIERLGRLHESGTELVTGFRHQSPW